jgi:hypothetical protein
MSEADVFLKAAIARCHTVRGLGEGVLRQVTEAELFHATDPEANSIAIVVRHLHGNMLSRWTDFLTTDGDKPNRCRDREFEQPIRESTEIRRLWDEGWACTLDALRALKPGDCLREVRVRNEPMTVIDAIIRQLSHYSYHVGQMVTLARAQLGARWQTLSIARGKSEEYKPQVREGGIKE